MEAVMIAELLLAAGALWLIRKNKSISGIGALKRKKKRYIWKEVQWAQDNNIDLDDKNGYEKHEDKLAKKAEQFIHNESDRPKYIRYFNQLRRAYQSISGTGLKPTQSIVYNDLGDVILVHYDYHLDQLPQLAAEHFRKSVSATDGYTIGYWYTITGIALGTLKFIWKGDKIHRGVEAMVFGRQAPTERKKRISYLANANKGGVTVDQYAHQLWQNITDGNGDDQEIANGIMDAIREFNSVGEAQDYIIAEYLKYIAPQEASLWQDIPF